LVVFDTLRKHRRECIIKVNYVEVAGGWERMEKELKEIKNLKYKPQKWMNRKVVY